MVFLLRKPSIILGLCFSGEHGILLDSYAAFNEIANSDVFLLLPDTCGIFRLTTIIIFKNLVGSTGPLCSGIS